MNSIFFKLSIRKLKKTKVYSMTNLVGLTVGFTAFALIALFIRYEMNWDKSHEKYDRIYRVQIRNTNAIHPTSGNNISPHNRPVTAQMIERQFPEFEKVTVINEAGSTFLGTDAEHQVHDVKGIYADTCFFDVFSFSFVGGEQEHALAQPYSVVLSETLAQKLFNKTNVLGESVLLENKHPLTVTGVYRDLPFNSSLRPSYIISFLSLKPLAGVDRSSFWAKDCMVYTLLESGVEAKDAEAKIQHLFAAYENLKFGEMQLCPLSKVYLNFNDSNDYLIILKLFGLIGVFILIMSGFNYVNLSLAQASMRGKEVAVKKVIGSRKQQLIVQFLGETVGVCVVALVMGLVATAFLLPLFNSVVDKQITFSLITDWKFVLSLLLLAVCVGLLSGVYPAKFMAASKITTLFKGNFLNKQQDTFSLKKALVTFQFAISLFLIVLTASFSMQIRYVANKDLGFQRDGLLYSELNASGNCVDFYQLRDRLLQHPEIVDVAMSKNFPFVNQGGGMTNWEGGDPNEKVTCRFNTVSYNYFTLLNTNLTAGRNFATAFSGDVGKSCVINEAAAKCFGWDDPIGKRVNDNQLTIVGVVEDFIYHDMHNPVEPSVLILAPNEIEGNWVFAFRVREDEAVHARNIITSELKMAFPNDPFEVKDFPSAFNSEYSFKIYHSVNKTLLFFTVLNILLAVVGMFGLVAFVVARRTKEIGIRKINGSSPLGIFHLLNREYYLLLLLAMLVAFPSAWLVYMSLPSANKLPAQPWIFVMGTGLLLLIVLVSTSYQTIKAATRNPIDALRYE